MADSRAEQLLWHLHHWLGSATASVDDGPLLERFVQQRDEDAFAELVSRHGPLVFGLCRRLLGNVQDAEDVFQATFLVLARKAATIRKPESLSCWLHGVAYRLALKAKAEANKRRIHERQAAPLCDNADTDLSWREVRSLLDAELQRLPEKQRLPLILCYLEGLTQDEASQRLGWPRGTLKRRLEAGRERLRFLLTQRGVTLGAGLFAATLTESATGGAVPAALRSATVRAAVQFSTHETAALAATPAALLANGALQTMLTTKLKFGAMVILLLGCVVTAAGLAIPQASPEKQLKNKAETPAPALSTKDKQARKDRYRRIASGSTDTTILIWDATGGARPDATLSAEQLRSLWLDLRDADAGRAYRALWQFALSPKQTLPFLTEKLRPAVPLDAMRQKQVDRLLADLDSEQFAVRQQVESELEKMGSMIEPALHKATENKPSLEVRRRIEKIQEKLANERLRLTRALEAIEHMNAPQAERLLEALADGEARAWLTEEARAIRKRRQEQSVAAP